MKAKKAARLRRLIDERVRSELEARENSQGFSVLSIVFENRAVDIPYRPWAPRERITLPGQWIDGLGKAE